MLYNNETRVDQRTKTLSEAIAIKVPAISATEWSEIMTTIVLLNGRIHKHLMSLHMF